MFKFIKKGDLEYFVSDIFPENVKHAFTTRKGGKDHDHFDDFSLGKTELYDSYEFVLNNRKLLCKELKMNFDNLVMTDQHHTDNIYHLTSPIPTGKDHILPFTDAVITINNEIPILLFFADCTPIILYDKKNKVMALIHAGWRGTEKQIACKTAQKLINQYNSSPEDIVAAIGPSIGKCCYEVSHEVANKLLDTIDETSISDKIISYKSSQPYVDLKLINAEQLRQCNITNIDVLDECTACNQKLFFSHRATHGQTGRHALIAQLT